MSDCTHCRNESHEACDGGAWDETLRPIPCVCSMEDHDHTGHWGGSAVLLGAYDDMLADQQAAREEDRYWARRGGDAA